MHEQHGSVQKYSQLFGTILKSHGQYEQIWIVTEQCGTIRNNTELYGTMRKHTEQYGSLHERYGSIHTKVYGTIRNNAEIALTLRTNT